MSLIALALHAEVAFVTAHHIIRVLLVMLLAAPIFNALGKFDLSGPQADARKLNPLSNRKT
jgi:hypothetical protein